MSVQICIVPGEPIASIDDNATPGSGCRRRDDGTIVASVYGVINKATDSAVNKATDSTTANNFPHRAVSVIRDSAIKRIDSTLLEGTTVLALVRRVKFRQAHVSIIGVDDRPTLADLKGVIRMQDARQIDRNTVKMSSCFRPGDTVRATVISSGDQSEYVLSTAQDNLGVVLAYAENGDKLLPLDSRHMTTADGHTEERKTARPW